MNVSITGAEIDAKNIAVRHEQGRCYGWPAKHGTWSWGNEILMQYKSGKLKDKPPGSHDIDYDQPMIIEQSRSFDPTSWDPK